MGEVLVHSDQGSQYTSHGWQDFLKEHGLVCSMSRRGNCHDNAVAESFFQLLKRERIKRKIYATRDAARQDIFDYIEDGDELVEQPFARLIDKRLLAIYRHLGFWRAMDTFKDKITLDRMEARGDCPWMVWKPR